MVLANLSNMKLGSPQLTADSPYICHCVSRLLSCGVLLLVSRVCHAICKALGEKVIKNGTENTENIFILKISSFFYQIMEVWRLPFICIPATASWQISCPHRYQTSGICYEKS